MNEYLIFNTFEDVNNALTIINNRMKPEWNYVEGMVWDVAKERLDNKWCFNKPKDKFLDGIEGYQIERYSHFWFITEEDFDKTINI
jgi:hypothetical protein